MADTDPLRQQIAAALHRRYGGLLPGDDSPECWLQDADAVLPVVTAWAEQQVRHEWQCPNCGATTQARMSDQEAGRG